MLGVSFLSRAIHQAQLHSDLSDQRNAITKLLGRGMAQVSELSEEQQALLFELAEIISHANYEQSELRCPECDEAMVVITLHDIEIDFCPSCRGFWFDHDELKAFTHQLEDVPGIRLASRPSKLPCPRCADGTHLRVYQFDRLHNLMIDCCPHCHGVYLQDQEFERSLAISNDD